MTARTEHPAAPADPPHPDSDPDRTLLARDVATAPAPVSSNVLPAGTQLAEFGVTGVIGEGGFGIVYRAHDRALQRTVAIKEYMPSALAARLADTRVVVKSEQHRETFEIGLKSFINEARLLAQFDHPALVKVFRFWAANGTAYMAMPLYEGGTLKQALKAMPAPPDEAWLRMLLGPLLDAIELLHAADCLHRDIAPDNVLMAPGSTARSPRPVLLDFGAARRVIGGQTQALTVILKPGYAPIEQYDEIPGMKQGPWTDLYALGAVMHFAITGSPPPPAVGRLVHDAWVPLSQAAAGRYSAGFLAAIDAALAARPDDRPRSVAQWRTQLADAAGGNPLTATAAMPAAGTSQTLPSLSAPTPSQATAAPRAMTGPAAPAGRGPDAAPRRRPRWAAAIGVGALAGGLLILGLWAALTWQTREPAARVSVPPSKPPQAVVGSEPTTPSAAPATVPTAGASARGDPAGGAPSVPVAARPPPSTSPPTSVPSASQRLTAPASEVAAPAPQQRGAPGRAASADHAATQGASTPAPRATPGAAAASAATATTAWIDAALREGRDCLAGRQYACTIARADSVLQADPNHPAARALLKEARAGQEAALGGDWKMR